MPSDGAAHVRFDIDRPETYSHAADSEIVISIQNALERNQIALQAELSRRMGVSIERFNAQSSLQTEKMLTLTRWILVLTAVMAVIAVVQIYTAFFAR